MKARLLLAIGLAALFAAGAKGEEASSSGTVMGKEGDSLTVWCGADYEFDSCQWTAPTGETCLLLHDDFGGQKKCLRETVARFIPESNHGNCSLTLSRLSLSHHGQWQCHLSQFGNFDYQAQTAVDVNVAKPANVDFVTVFGTVTVAEGRAKDFTCRAKHGRPAGVFVWEVLDANDPSEGELLQPQSEPTYEEDDQQFYTATQTISFVPKPRNDGMNLRCTYEQYDLDENRLFEGNSDCQEEIELSVHYLEKAADRGPIALPDATIGSDYTVAIDFAANPKPNPEEVEWVIRTPTAENRINLVDNAFGDKYVAHPLEDLPDGKNRHLANLTILGVQAEDTAHDYALRVSYRDPSPSGDEGSVTEEYMFRLQTSRRPNYDDGDDVEDGEEEGMETNAVIIIVVVVVVVVVIVALVVGMVCYAKNNGVWCYAPPAIVIRAISPDPESVSVPLNKHPGLKNNFKRPA